MAPLPPPSFDSFPDLQPPISTAKLAKPTTSTTFNAPPSFNSFPEQKQQQQPIDSNSDLNSRPTKRSKPSTSTSNNSFLDDLEFELNSNGKELESISSRKGRNDELNLESGNTIISRSSKGKGRSRDEDQDDDRDKKRDSKRDSSSRHKDKESKGKRSEEKGKGKERDKERYGERDRDFGAPVKKAWKLVAEGKTTTTSTISTIESRSPTPPPTEERLFYSDAKGDKLNIRYGGLDKSKVPRYRRLGAGRVVGFNSGLRITKETAYTGRGLEVGPLAQYRTPRYSDSRSVNHLSNKHAKRITIINRPPPSFILGESTNSETPSSNSQILIDDPFLSTSLDPTRFVPFQPVQSLSSKLDNLEYEEGTEYRSIAGLIKPSDLLSDSDEEGIDDIFSGLGIPGGGGESQSQYLARKNIELDRELRSKPLLVEKWIEFVEFQDEVAQLSFGTGSNGGGTKRALSVQERTSTSEIKLSILDRALAVPGNEKSEVLLLAYLKAAAEVWDPKRVLLRWTETLRSHPNLTGLWLEFISFRQTNFISFGVREVVEVFEDSFKVLIGAMEKERIGTNERESLEGNAIYLFLRCCLMLRQAGFSERALAAFQGIIELNFFRSESNQRPAPFESQPIWRTRILEELEEFWDSEVHRVGEDNAKGWCNSSMDSDAPSAPPPTTVPSSTPENPFERWASTEQLTATFNSLPARTTDPGIDDDIDPFRVVLFDDIRDFLFVVHSPDSKSQLAYAFLTFLGLPFIPPDCSTSNPFTTDTFIHSELAERSLARDKFWPKEEVMNVPFDTIQGEAMEPERRSALKEPFDTPFCTTPVSVELLFSSRSKWFTTLKKEDLLHVDFDFARNVFTLLRPIVPPDGFFTLDFFSFEAVQSPKTAIKIAKQILKLPENRQNLSLWDGYARIERQRGKTEDARNVYVTALSMSRSFVKQEQVDAPLLWRAWSEMEWEGGRPNLALQILVASTLAEEVDLATLAKDEETRPSSTAILRARQHNTSHLEAAFQPNTSPGILRNRNHLAYSTALFEYISEGIEPAVEVLERHLFRLDYAGVSGSAEHEEAFMLYVKLLYRHSEAGGPYKPGQLRDVLERAIMDFPNNTLFLSVFYSNELRMKIQNRVRRTLENSVLKDNSVTSDGWLFAIFAELHLDARSQSVWGVRNLFDRAIENPRTRPSASIWMLYIDFEIRNKELGRAKSLLYRALREIPWCKELYLKPFSPPLSTMYKSTELKEMHSLLLEKGLRVREELEIGGWTSDVEMVMGEDSDEDIGGVVKDVENLYSERQRLMPY